MSIAKTHTVKKIREIRGRVGLSQTEFAEKLGVTQHTVSRWETGLQRPRDTVLMKISQIFGIQVDDVIVAESAPPHLHVPAEGGLVPVVGITDAGPGLEAYDGDYPAGFSDEWVSRPHGLKDKSAFGLRIGPESDSMYPALKPGMLVVVSPNIGAKSGDMAFVKTKDGDSRIKEVQFGDNELILISYKNDKREAVPNSEVEAVYPVVWWRRAK